KINSINAVLLKISDLTSKISSKENDITAKRALYKEYKSFVKSYSDNLNDKKVELDKVLLELEKSNIKEIDKKTLIYDQELNKFNVICNEKLSESKKRAHLLNERAVLDHSLSQKIEDSEKLIKLINKKEQIAKEMEHYPSVISAFGTSGIPNLIIQNVLDDLQSEANKLLDQLKPGLQLAFVIEKEKSDDDTLDITYFVN